MYLNVQMQNYITIKLLKQIKMEKKFEVLPPIMPNFVRFKKEAGLRQTFQDYHNFNRQNNSTKPLLVAGAVN